MPRPRRRTAAKPLDTAFSLPGDKDRLADLGRIASGLVHELKNPLGVILLNAELMTAQNLDDIPDPAARDRARRRLARISDSGKNLQAIVQAFLAFARPSRPDPEAVDINAVLAGLIEEGTEQDVIDALQVTFHPEPHLPQVPADAVHLRSIFRNVLGNAREALRERGEDRRLLVLTRSGPGIARVVIANNGPAIPPQVAAHLFEPFISGKESGTGLGLAIVRRLVELHGGTVQVSSDPHQGVCFTFEFPTPLGPALPRAELPMPASEATVRA